MILPKAGQILGDLDGALIRGEDMNQRLDPSAGDGAQGLDAK